MKCLLVIASVIAVCKGQGGYSYNAPSSGGIGGFSSEPTAGSGNSYASMYSQGGSSGVGHSGLSAIGGTSGFSNTFSSGGGNSIGLNMNKVSFGNSGAGISGQSSGFSGSGFSGSALSGSGFSGNAQVSNLGSSYSNYASQAPIVHKHVYVHVPPADPEENVFRAPPVLPPPQKHYKIIFVKAPSPPAYTNPIIPAQQQNEEKTLVYVLVKKPEDQPDIVIPSAAPTQPSKPEVYFIKYKSLKESAGGIGGGISGSGGASGIGGINGGVSGIGGIGGGISGGSGSGPSAIGGIGLGGGHESIVVDNPFAKSPNAPAPVYGPPSSQMKH